jgi:hypothetical protein
MAKISLSSPPVYKLARYPKYREWLDVEFFRHVCCYFFLDSNDGTEIEHVVPQSYAPSMIHDPHNLLLACPKCNKLKLDYHPAHKLRKRLKDDTTGFQVIDPRSDDYSGLFSLDLGTGSIKGHSKRATWNIVLFDFHLRDTLAEKRRIYAGFAKCLDLFLQDPALPRIESVPWANEICNTLAQFGYLYLLAFDIEISSELSDLLRKRRMKILARKTTSAASSPAS